MSRQLPLIPDADAPRPARVDPYEVMAAATGWLDAVQGRNRREEQRLREVLGAFGLAGLVRRARVPLDRPRAVVAFAALARAVGAGDLARARVALRELHDAGVAARWCPRGAAGGGA